jgi:hypothetical protein
VNLIKVHSMEISQWDILVQLIYANKKGSEVVG